MPPGFHRLIAAQFASALADNALLIVTIALLVERQLPGWWAPLLKFSFTLGYVLLAPFLGPLADAVPKAKLMGWMNALKVLGVIALLAGVHPVLAFAGVGLAACAMAPAKYGLITEIVPPRQLVAANGWIEVSVVGAVLLGTVLGGLLVSPLWRGWGAAVVGDAPLALSLGSLLVVYAIAAWLNLGLPASGAVYPKSGIHPLRLVREFAACNRRLWRDAEGGLSLAATTIFWGAGATLQFAVLVWAERVLRLPLDRAAYLQAAVAVGVVIGAGIAGRWIALRAARRVLPLGVLLGLAVPLTASVNSLGWAVPLLALLGLLGGLMVVPMNALLQHRGHALLTAGRSIAVQGFNENLSVLVMLGAYAALLRADVSIIGLMWGFGLSVAGGIALLMLRSAPASRAAPDEVPG
ncbi:lysophospholipid transporter LplT [Aquincola sp. S2]|uniref:Lysophospholipid transporter LplT n=1 Tax=Pseudaquabacterium terrae TaxID=2732868 RepID=A0ABX2EJT5_9BURK|nr:lysophospholipid transporter LplT [Aquabacterium terrae]NRF68912.1 lysophospholipid transporter LplT [Aquabacterium terrae]